MQKIHIKLTQKYPKYHNWHQAKHHNKIHWGILAIFTLLIFGTISRWTPISFAADTVPPITPTNLTATVISSSQINLSWTASTDDLGVTGYKIYRCTGSGCTPTTQISTSATNSYPNTGLTASTAYTYTVSAYDAAGNESAQSTAVTATTKVKPTGIIFQDNFDGHPDWTRKQLLFPTNDECYSGNCDTPAGWDSYYNGCSFCGSDPGHNTLNLNSENPRGGSGKSLTFWDESCYEGFGDSTGELGKNLGKNYQELYIRYYIKFAPGYKWLPNATPQHKLGHVWYYQGTGTPFQFFNSGNQPILVPGVLTYEGNIYYWVGYRCEEQYKCNGTPSYNFVVDGDMDYIKIGNIETAPIDGNWHSMEYHIKMNTYNETTKTFNADGIHRFWLDGKLIYGATNIPWSDNGSNVDPRRGFNYISFGGNNNNRWTTNCTGTGCEQWYAIDDIVISTTYIGPDDSPPDDSPPTSPQNLTATVVSSTQIDLFWTTSTDDVGVTGYRVERCQGTGCTNFTQISTPTAVSYSDTGLLANTTYRYQVRAVDAAGNFSDYSIIASATTPQVSASGKVYYVSPTGSATWPQCTDINTPCSAQTGMKNALAGDIVYFRGGTYNVGQSASYHGVLEPANSGTASYPITFMAYPGETPVMNASVEQKASGTATGGSATTLVDTSKDFVALGVSGWQLVVNTTTGSTAAVGSVTTNTITFQGSMTQGSRNNFQAGDSYAIGLDLSKALGNGDKDYIIFDGFTVQANNGTRMGGMIITGDNIGRRVVGNQVKNCIINGGTTKITNVDNREGLRLGMTTNTTVSGCRFYSFRQEGSGQLDYPNTAAIKAYNNDGLIVENNEFYNASNGLYFKRDTDNSIVRYNYFHNNYRSLMIAIYYTNQSFSSDGNKYYHNVFANNTYSAFGGDTQCETTYHANDAEIYNNTIYNSVRGISYMQNEPGHGAKVYNNIIQGNSNLQIIGICEPAELVEEDHNQFGTAPLTIGMRLYGVTQKNYTNLSPSWIGSSELVGGNHPGVGSLRSDPLFVNGSGTFTQLSDFKLSSSSPSKGTGRNGADMGADIDLVGPAGTGKIDITPPLTPSGLTATPISSSQINLSWTASSDNVGVTGYNIYRCAGSACAPTTQIATSAVNSYSNTGLTASTAYTYAVSAYDAAGNESGKSGAVSATTLSQFKQADFNKDGIVNQLDFDILKQDWKRTDKPKSDLNQDGIVNSQDLGIMMSEWTR